MMGLVTGDALGNAIQFMSREEVRERGFSVLREGTGIFGITRHSKFPAHRLNTDMKFITSQKLSFVEFIHNIPTVTFS